MSLKVVIVVISIINIFGSSSIYSFASYSCNTPLWACCMSLSDFTDGCQILPEGLQEDNVKGLIGNKRECKRITFLTLRGEPDLEGEKKKWRETWSQIFFTFLQKWNTGDPLSLCLLTKLAEWISPHSPSPERSGWGPGTGLCSWPEGPSAVSSWHWPFQSNHLCPQSKSCLFPNSFLTLCNLLEHYLGQWNTSTKENVCLNENQVECFGKNH